VTAQNIPNNISNLLIIWGHPNTCFEPMEECCMADNDVVLIISELVLSQCRDGLFTMVVNQILKSVQLYLYLRDTVKVVSTLKCNITRLGYSQALLGGQES
jgi:hypothetical protein